MKRIINLLIVIVTVIMLTACGANNNEVNVNNSIEEVEKVEYSVKITLSKDDGEDIISEKEVQVSAENNLLEVMQANYEIEQEDGFIQSIDGIAAESNEQKAWMFFINGEIAMVGAKDINLAEGDHVVFDFQAWE